MNDLWPNTQIRIQFRRTHLDTWEKNNNVTIDMILIRRRSRASDFRLLHQIKQSYYV